MPSRAWCRVTARSSAKMGHTERYEKNLFKNIAGEKEQSLFRNAVDYFRKN